MGLPWGQAYGLFCPMVKRIPSLLTTYLTKGHRHWPLGFGALVGTALLFKRHSLLTACISPLTVCNMVCCCAGLLRPATITTLPRLACLGTCLWRIICSSYCKFLHYFAKYEYYPSLIALSSARKKQYKSGFYLVTVLHFLCRFFALACCWQCLLLTRTLATCLCSQKVSLSLRWCAWHLKGYRTDLAFI